MIKTTIIYGLLILCISCQENTPRHNEVITVDHSLGKTQKSSTWFSSVTACPLQTSEEYLIGNIKQVETYAGQYYILDEANNCIFTFDTTGCFLQKFSKIGRGPGEYTNPTDIKVDSRGIFLLDYSQQAILHYDLKWQFLNKIRFDSYPVNFLLTPSGFFLYSERTNQKNDYCFYETNDTGKILNHFILRDKIKDRKHNYIYSNVFCHNNNNLFFSTRYSNYIYSQNNDSVIYQLDFKNKNFPETELELNDYNIYDPSFPYIVREHIFTYDSLLWIGYLDELKRQFAIYNTETKKTIFCGSIINDLIADFRFFPQWQNGKCLIDCVSSYNIVNDFPFIFDQFPNLKTLKDTDNPVLLIYKPIDK